MNQIKLVINGKDLIAEIASYGNKQHVAITPICEAIGIAPNKQRERLQDVPQFNPYHMVWVASDGKQREMLMLPVEEVGMWLCSINARRVKEEVRDVLVAFQKHCQVELHAAITGTAGMARVAALEEQMIKLSSLVEELVAERATDKATIAALTATNESLWKARGYEGSAASYTMHAAKERKKAVNLIQ